MIPNLLTLFVNWSNGAFIMTVVFGLVIIGLVAAVLIFINNSIKKEQREKELQEKEESNSLNA
ncbi:MULTISPECIES: hypothetical protein [Psychroflexus]|uniref:Oxaloacetate decarboxylase, gamma chain n=1 Tax=Psychroflexus halocasei TaxID=908615 RepID=A0A1H4CQ33_9FLAO|nr:MULTISPECIES: hypothetical protein [Psychroflexus]SEA62408.1 hypothetical protein SAMN05421540_108103 [Psychroflexus halocasei]